MRANELPASPSRSVLMIGMPPPTAASKLSATPFFSASSASATPCLREQRLVGGDDRLAGRERRLDRGLGGIALAADQLDEHVDAGIARERDRIVDPAQLRQIDAAVLGLASARVTATTSIGRPQRAASAVALLRDQPHHRRADRAETGKTHFERRDHESIRKLRDGV